MQHVKTIWTTLPKEVTYLGREVQPGDTLRRKWTSNTNIGDDMYICISNFHQRINKLLSYPAYNTFNNLICKKISDFKMIIHQYECYNEDNLKADYDLVVCSFYF